MLGGRQEHVTLKKKSGEAFTAKEAFGVRHGSTAIVISRAGQTKEVLALSCSCRLVFSFARWMDLIFFCVHNVVVSIVYMFVCGFLYCMLRKNIQHNLFEHIACSSQRATPTTGLSSTILGVCITGGCVRPMCSIWVRVLLVCARGRKHCTSF